MYYLISTFAWWLLVAFLLGIFIGWITCTREDGSPRTGSWLRSWVSPALMVALIALGAVVFRLINGVPALWVETALLFFTAYLTGCCIGCLLRQLLSDQPVATGVSSWMSNQGDRATPLAPAMASPATGGVRDWHADRTGLPPVTEPPQAERVFSPAPAAMPEPGVRGWHANLAQDEPAPAAQPLAVMPNIEGEEAIEGARPMGLVGPRAGKADDLKLIRGIGKQNEGRLHALGIWHFDQIAAWTPDNALWVGSYLAFPGRIEREEWITQARQLAAGVDTAFAKRVKAGDVATSTDDGDKGSDNIADLSTMKGGDEGKPPPKS